MSSWHTCPAGHSWSVRVETDHETPCCPRCGRTAVPLGSSGAVEQRSDLQANGAADVVTLVRPGRSVRMDDADVEDSDARFPSVPGYEILSVLGHGGMGIVYRACQRSLTRLVALKMIRANQMTSGEGLLRFRTEALAVAQLNHPHIIQIHEIGEADGVPYISLELVEGGNLDEWMNGRPQSLQETAGFIERVARAVHAAHVRGLIHRDLKPANLLLDWEIGSAQCLTTATPKIADFGLAKQIGDDDGLTQTGQVVGTPSYMAPEQANPSAGAVGPWTDVYALGAILYEMLTGRPPYDAPTGMETLRLMLDTDPRPPRQLRRDIPRDLETIVLKGLAKDPRQRYLSAEELAEDLRRFQAGEPILARPIGFIERWTRRARRNPVVASLAGVLLFIVLGLLVGGAILLHQREETHRVGRIIVRDLLAEVTNQEERARESRQPGHFDKALQHLERAEDHLNRVRDPALRRQADVARARLQDARQEAQQALDERQREAEFTRQLETIRSEWLMIEMDDGMQSNQGQILRQVLNANGIPLGQATPEEVVDAVRLRPRLHKAIVEALIEGSVTSTSLDQVAEYIEIVNRLEQNPDGLRVLQWLRTDPELLLDPDKLALLERLPVSYTLATGLRLLNRKNYTAAARTLRLGVAREPSNFWLHYHIGYVAHQRKPQSPGAAIAAYTTALALRPTSGHTLSNLSICLFENGDADEAVIYLRRACELQPEFASYHCTLGAMLRRLGQTTEARQCLDRSLAINPNSALAMMEVSMLELMNGRFDESAKWARLSLTQLPNNDTLRAMAQQRLQGIQRFQREKLLLDQVLRGDKELSSAKEACSLMEQCFFRGKHLDAYRLNLRAFERFPGLENQRTGTWYRFNAACYAALASHIEIDGAARLTVAERAEIRRNALTWLQAELQELQRLIDVGQQRGKLEVNQALGEWLTDPALASIRDRQHLDRLDEDERREWQKLWAEVEVLRARLQ